MAKQGPEPGQSRKPRAVPALLIREHEVTLPEGETLIGRGPAARISILGSLISREHARLSCRDGRVTVVDAGSRNGVFVNGTRINTQVMLEDGDTLLVGTTQLTYFLGPPDDAPGPDRRVFDEQGNMLPEGEFADETPSRTELRFESVDTIEFDREEVTIQGTQPPKPRVPSAPHARLALDTESPSTPMLIVQPAALESGEMTRPLTIGRIKPAVSRARKTTSAPPPPLVGPAVRPSPPPAAMPELGSSPRAAPGQEPMEAALEIIDRMLVRGDADAASRALGGHLTRRLDSARAGESMPTPLVDKSALRCVSLLELTGDPRWFDLLIELYFTAAAPMPAALLERVAPFVGVVPSSSQQALGQYQNLIRELLGEVDVESLGACERILTLGS